MAELSSKVPTNESVHETNGKPTETGQDDPYYISAPAPPAGERDRVLNQGDTFAVFDHHGDIRPAGLKEQGLFHEGTRFLSCLVLRLGGGDPMFLSSTVNEDNAILAVDLTNPDVCRADHVELPRGSVHLFRSVFLWKGVCYQRLRIRNFGLGPVAVPFSLRFDADFADIFEVRGTHRSRRGHDLDPVVEPASATLGYKGLDGVIRRARLDFSPAPDRLTATDAHFAPTLGPQEERLFHLTVSCEIGDPGTARPPAYGPALERASGRLRALKERACQVRTTNERFNAWLTRSRADLDMLIGETPDGPYPYAGVPWFSTPFGRDGEITALEALWANPDLARGVLGYLAATQADSDDPERDAQPGKILHETRRGEMAALGEIPFGRYYGSVDSTPLFVLLAGAYFERTGDRAFAETLWPHIERALAWINGPGDRDKDGFVEYFRMSKDGLAQQGWKDSHDSVFHADGHLAEGPIALCEVQGYVYAAKLGVARLAAALGHTDRATELTRQANELREKFERAFWCEDLGTYAIALDGAKRPCRVRTSNPGQCLYTGIVGPERAARLAETLLDKNSFSGWGVRTVAAGEVRYNPMSYHDGSVWPHDNAVIGAGLARYRAKDAVVKILGGMFDASQFVDLHRMPELFCGFPRRPGQGPTLYPVACSPQAWAAGSVFMLLQACLGLEVNAAAGRVGFHYPVLPAFLRKVLIQNLRVGDGSVDLMLTRRGEDVSLNVLGRHGRVEVAVVK